jgi:hypothetical protein
MNSISLENELRNGVYINESYIEWQLARMKFIVYIYGKDFFKGKKILELGCFQGGLTKMFYNLGANITGVEGSKSNFEELVKKYPYINFKNEDCEITDEWKFDEHYDIIIHWGLLYHLKNMENSITECMKHTDLMFLESIVINTSFKEKFLVRENVVGIDQAIHGMGSRASIGHIEKILDNYYYVRYDNSFLNSPFQPHYDIPIQNISLRDSREFTRKFWTVRPVQ